MAVRHSYVGLLDDFAARHSDTAIASVDDLNRNLVLAVLFSDPLLINDGYVLHHPAIEQALLQPDKSPLKALVEVGFVKILSRNSNALGSLVDVMADAGIVSAQQRKLDEGFQKTYQPFLQRWSGELSTGAFDAFLPWPKIHIDQVFRSVAGTVMATESFLSDVGDGAVKAFRARLDGSSFRRTEWELAGNALRDGDQVSPAAHSALMRAANETYQYAWGCALTASLSNVRVLTRLPRHLRALESSGVLVLPDKPKKPVEVMVPDAAFVLKAVGNKWERLASMVTPGHEINRLKHTFLGSLRAYYSEAATDHGDVSTAATAYTTALSRHFGGKSAAPVVFDLSFVGLSTIAGAYAGSPAGPFGAAAGAAAGAVAGAAVGVFGVAAAHLGAPKLLWRLTAPSPKKWLLHKNPAVAEGVTSCFEIEPDLAKVHIAHAARP